MNTDAAGSETQLWQAVVMQAVLDLAISSERNADKLTKADAVRWFKRGGSDFTLVCSNASMCSHWVRNGALNLMKTRGKRREGS